MATSPSQKWEDGRLVERAQPARGEPEENTAQAVTGRPNDNPIREPEPAPLGGNSTFAERAKARGAQAKAVSSDEAEDKAVRSSERKTRRKTR